MKLLKNYKDDQKLFQLKHVVSSKDAQILRAIEQIPGVSLFEGLPITRVIRLEEINGSVNEVVMFKSSKKAEQSTREQLSRKIDGITKEVIGISEYVLQLLEVEDDEKEQMNFLQQMEVKYSCLIKLNKVIKKDEEIVWEEVKEKDDQKLRLKLKIERETIFNNELVIYAVRKKEATQVRSEIITKLEDLETKKKFFKMPGKTGPHQQSQWEYVLNKVGLREQKTDFTIQMQKRLKVLMFAAESEKFKGIMIYGEQQLQKIAFLELGAEFKLHKLQCVSVQLSNTLAQLLTQKRRVKISQQIKSEFQSFRPQFMMYISGISGKALAVVYSVQSGAEKIKEKLEEYLVLCEHKIRYQVLEEEYFILKDHIPRICLAQEHKVLFYFNNSSQNQQFKFPVFGDQAVWMYARISEEGHEEWHRYEKDRNKELEKYYQEEQEFFLLGSSNFEVPKGHPERWNEQTDESRYRIKRATILKKIEGEGRMKILPPKNLLLRAFPKDMTQMKSTLMNEFEELAKRSTFYDVQHGFKPHAISQVEQEFQVKVEEHQDGKKVRIIGIRRDEAMRALLKYVPLNPSRSFNEDGDFTIALQEESDQFKQQASLFKEQMRYSKALEIEKIQRIQQPRDKQRYQREREMMEATMTPQAFKDSERTLYQSLPPRNLDDIQNPHHLRGNLFSASPRYFWDSASTSKQEVLVVQVLLGLRYRAAKQECTEQKEWRVPPKIIQETFCLESDDEGDEDETTQRRKQEEEYDPDAELNQLLAHDDSRFLQKAQNRSMSLVARPPVNLSEYYDSVELLTEKGQAFVVFHQNYALPQYLITYTLNNGSHALSARNGSKNSARSSFSIGSKKSVHLS